MGRSVNPLISKLELLANLIYKWHGFSNHRDQGYCVPVVSTVTVTVENCAKFIKNSNYFLNLFEFKEVTTIFLLPYPVVRPVTAVTARLPMVM